MAKSKDTMWTVEIAHWHDSELVGHRYAPGTHTVNADLKAEMAAVEGLVTHAVAS